ncbi:MAG TPA: competence/damage-inducible protein A [Candidatus Eisenbacteria bacterium]|jgi:nicotinamide-nucleotide amidase|nr:competence/damage-inducible protein A [Candidatus Eisenbacteria bacterium]
MRAEILSIGTELLVGSILNTNARFLSRKLAESAIDVYWQTTVGDNPARIAEALDRALERSDVVVTSGGLGPTEDDVTTRGLSLALRLPLVPHAPTYRSILRRVRARGLRMTRLIARQCAIPAGARAIPNDHGTAPGLLLSVRRGGREKWILVLPGPPRELEPMFVKRGLPLLLTRSGAPKESFVLKSLLIAGLIEAQVAQKVTDLLRLKPPVTVGIYARPGEVELKIMAKAPSRAEARRRIARVETTIRRRLGRKVFGADGETLEGAVGNLLRRGKWTLATAESCTGGSLAGKITDCAGSSRYFKGGVVAYSPDAKCDTLGIDPSLIRRHGPVSGPVASALARGARSRFGTHFGIGVTGNAGPTLDRGSRAPVGTVYIAIEGPRRGIVKKIRFLGSRSEIKSRAAQEALNLLRLELLP